MIKIRASKIGNLMTSPTAKELSKGGKTQIKELWLERELGYRPIVNSKYLKKGLNRENDSIGLLSMVDGDFYVKNEKRVTNEYLTGECDIITVNKIIDVKTSWDVKTFWNADLTKLYEWQLRAYMELYDCDKAELVYCLLDASADTVLNEQQKAWYQYNNINPDFMEDEESLKAYEIEADQIEKNLVIGEKLTPSQRIKRFKIERDEELTKQMYNQVIKANEYYQTINF